MFIRENHILYNKELYKIQTINWSGDTFTIYVSNVLNDRNVFSIWDKKDFDYFNLIKPYKKVTSIFKKLFKEEYERYESNWVQLYIADSVLALQMFTGFEKELGLSDLKRIKKYCEITNKDYNKLLEKLNLNN